MLQHVWTHLTIIRCICHSVLITLKARYITFRRSLINCACLRTPLQFILPVGCSCVYVFRRVSLTGFSLSLCVPSATCSPQSLFSTTNHSIMDFIYLIFEVFTAVTMKNCVFWDVTPCGSCKNRLRRNLASPSSG
jgi:hypothetical protein